MNPSNYDTGFPYGVTIRSMPIEFGVPDVNNVWWIDSVNGSNSNKGNIKYPLATLAYAMANKVKSGDRVFVAPSHNETVSAAAGILFNVANVIVEFLGEGTSRGTITFGTATTASISITANGVTLIGPRFVAGIDALSAPISITGTDCTIVNAEWFDAAAKAATNGIVATNAASRLTIDGYKYFSSTTGTQKATHIKFADIASPVLKNIDIRGDFSTAPINITAACTNAVYENWNLSNTNATPKPGLDQHANCTFLASNINIRIASGTTYVSSVGKGNWSNTCLGYSVDGTAGVEIGTQQGASSFWIKKTVTSSAISNLTALDITGVSSGGELAVEDVILKTDSTGLAGGTNFQLLSNNAKGNPLIVAEAVASLGASVTVDLESASVRGVKTVIESGKKLQVQSTVGACTGGGTIDIYVKFSCLTPGAIIAAA